MLWTKKISHDMYSVLSPYGIPLIHGTIAEALPTDMERIFGKSYEHLLSLGFKIYECKLTLGKEVKLTPRKPSRP